MPCFARVSGIHVVCSEITDCGKSEQNPASCYYLLVVKLVVKGERVTTNFYHQCITLSASFFGTSKCFSFLLFFNI